MHRVRPRVSGLLLGLGLGCVLTSVGCQPPPPLPPAIPEEAELVCPVRADDAVPKPVFDHWDEDLLGPRVRDEGFYEQPTQWMRCWGHAKAILTAVDHASRPCDEGIFEFFVSNLASMAPARWRSYEGCDEHADALANKLLICVLGLRGPACAGLEPPSGERQGCWDRDVATALRALVCEGEEDSQSCPNVTEAQLVDLEPEFARVWAKLRPRCAQHADALASVAVSRVLESRSSYFSSNADWHWKYQMVADPSCRNCSRHTRLDQLYWRCWEDHATVSDWACDGQCPRHHSLFQKAFQKARMRKSWKELSPGCSYDLLDRLVDASMMCIYEGTDIHWCTADE